MSTDNRNEAFLDRIPAQPGEETHAYRAVGFAASAALHGLALFVMLMVVQHGMQTARSGLLSVPVEIDRVTPDLKAGEKITLPPRQEPVPDASSQAQSGANGPSATAQLDAKLRRYRSSASPTRATEPGTSASHTSALDDDAMPGQQALYSVRDLIRAQVERRWNFDLASSRRRPVLRSDPRRDHRDRRRHQSRDRRERALGRPGLSRSPPARAMPSCLLLHLPFPGTLSRDLDLVLQSRPERRVALAIVAGARFTADGVPRESCKLE